MNSHLMPPPPPPLPPAHSRASSNSLDVGAGGKPALLCVDDQAAVLSQLQITFRKAFQVTVATDPHDALARLRDGQRFALIVSDQSMPKMQGDQFLAAARLLDPVAGRMLLTGFDSPEAVINAKNAGDIHAYLTKPWTDQDLLDKANHVARLSLLRRALPPAAPTANTSAGAAGPNEPERNTETLLVGPRANALGRPTLCRELGMRAHLLPNLERAIDYIADAAQPPSLLVVDLALGSATQLEALETLKAVVPAIVVLAMISETHSQDHLALGALVNRVNPLQCLPPGTSERDVRAALIRALERCGQVRNAPVLAHMQAPIAATVSMRTGALSRLQQRARAWMGQSIATLNATLQAVIGRGGALVPPQTDGSQDYVGEVLAINTRHLLQRVSARSGVAHERDQLESSQVVVGAPAVIRYVRGLGIADPISAEDAPPGSLGLRPRTA